MYNVNDSIIYGSHGVCTITEIGERNFYGTPNQYYILKPISSAQSTLYIPVDNEKLTQKMRRVLSPDEIHALIKAMPEQNADWIENENERKEKCRQILLTGDRMQLISLIKTLYAHEQEQKEKGRKLHLSDQQFFRDAEKLLYEEFSVVLNINMDQVLPMILEEMASPVLH